MKNINLDDATLSNLKEILGYLIETEEKSYEEYVFNNFENFFGEKYEESNFVLSKDFYSKPEVKHIYAVARQVKDCID